MRRQEEGYAYMASLTPTRYPASPPLADPLTTMNNDAFTMAERGDLDGARALYEQVIAQRKIVNGGEHPLTLTVIQNLAATMHEQGHHDEARRLSEHVLEIRRRVLGAAHPDTLMSINNLARKMGVSCGGARSIETSSAGSRKIVADA